MDMLDVIHDSFATERKKGVKYVSCWYCGRSKIQDFDSRCDGCREPKQRWVEPKYPLLSGNEQEDGPAIYGEAEKRLRENQDKYADKMNVRPMGHPEHKKDMLKRAVREVIKEWDRDDKWI